MAALGPAPQGETETERALAQLRARATATRQPPVHVWLLAADAAALLVAVLVSVEPWRNEPGDLGGGGGGREASRDNLARIGATPSPISEWTSRRTDREVGTGVALSARRQTTPRLIPAEQRTKAPGFSLPALKGGSATLADYAGRVLLLNFWATWCGPCRIEMPWFVAFQNTFAEHGFGVLGVSVDETGWNVVLPFLDREPVNYRIAIADTAERLAPSVRSRCCRRPGSSIAKVGWPPSMSVSWTGLSSRPTSSNCWPNENESRRTHARPSERVRSPPPARRQRDRGDAVGATRLSAVARTPPRRGSERFRRAARLARRVDAAVEWPTRSS